MKILYSAIFVIVLTVSVFAQFDFGKKRITKPEKFAEGIISTSANNEFNITFTKDGKTAYFTRRTGDKPQRIYISEFADGKWSTPQIAPFSNDRDESAFLSPDGKTIYFGSTRSVPGNSLKGKFDMNVWKTVKTEDGWSLPVPATGKINQIQTAGEEFPIANETSVFSNDGMNFYFSTQRRGTKGIDLYKTTLENGEFTEPEKLSGEVNSEQYWESFGTISPDGKYLFSNIYGAPKGYGEEDIYISRRTEAGWSKPVNLGEIINTESNEAAPNFSPDGKYFFFSREEKNSNGGDGIWSLYFLETASLNLDNKFPGDNVVSPDQIIDSLTDTRLKATGELYTGKIADFYENGKPKLWREVKNGFADGLWMEWLENGNLRYRAYWRNGKGDGLWQYFHDNGKPRTEGIYEDDIPKGVHYVWHSNGQLRVKEFYLDGKKEGEWIFYLPNGEVEKTEIYKNDQKVVQ